ncbi:RebB family R body protein [Aurantivibrio plasticivorans]
MEDENFCLNWGVVGMSPAVSMGHLYMTTAWNTGQSMAQSVQAQLFSYATMQAATVRSVDAILGQPTTRPNNM